MWSFQEQRPLCNGGLLECSAFSVFERFDTSVILWVWLTAQRKRTYFMEIFFPPFFPRLSFLGFCQKDCLHHSLKERLNFINHCIFLKKEYSQNECYETNALKAILFFSFDEYKWSQLGHSTKHFAFHEKNRQKNPFNKCLFVHSPKNAL